MDLLKEYGPLAGISAVAMGFMYRMYQQAMNGLRSAIEDQARAIRELTLTLRERKD